MTSWQKRLDSVLRSWQYTPWAPGQCCRGRGVDCRFFIMAVLDELFGITEPLPPRLPQDTGINNRIIALNSIRQITGRYPCRPMDREPPEAGDILIVRRPNSAGDAMPHGMIVGVGNPLPIWHSSSGMGVCYSSLAGWAIAHAFRPLNKESWAS